MANTLRNNWDLILSGLLRCIYNPDFLEKYVEFIKPKFFYEGETDVKVVAMRKLFELVIDLYSMRRHKLILGSLLGFEQEVKKLADGEVLDEALQIIHKLSTDEKLNKMSRDSAVEIQFLDLMKMTRVREWTTEFSRPWKSGRMDEAQELITKLSVELQQLNKHDYQVFDTKNIVSFLESQSRHSGRRNFRIGISELDGPNGWIEPRTLNIFAAPTGKGKSMESNTICRLAILQGRYTHLTVVENRDENAIPRLVASLTGLTINDIKNNFGSLSPEMKRRVEKAQELIDKYITITFMYGEGIEAVHSMKTEIDNKRKVEGKPKIEIDLVDYTGHIVSYSSGSNSDPMHIRFRNAYARRKDFCLKTDKIGFDFVQINRSGTKKNDYSGSSIDLGDLATSFDLSQVCDTIITINQSLTDAEVDEARFFVAKGREGGGGKSYLVKTMFKYGRFGMDCRANPSLPVEVGNYENDMPGLKPAEGLAPDNVVKIPGKN